MTAVPGTKVEGSEEILLDGKKVCSPGEKKRVVLAFYKKRGTVTSTVDQGRERSNIIDAVNYPERVFPVGRLDRDSEGLILLTNDGELVNGLLRSRFGHEKEYEVILDRPVTDAVLSRMREGGLPLLTDRKTKPCGIRRISGDSFICVLTEGMNREIRRMAEYFGYSVRSLRRVRFLFITLDGLKPGEYRELSEEEVRRLRLLAGSGTENDQLAGNEHDQNGI